MISCTEFIPAYSELFSFLDENYGRAEVDAFWKYLFVPDGKGIPLIGFVEREGIRGCWSYWTGTLNEEAADFTMYLNEKRGFYYNVMHKCPSKGRLLQLKDEIGITPYHDYCLHCDSYRSAVEKVGLKYIYNFDGIDEAACSMLIYDPRIFDGRVIIDEDTLVMDRKASDNEYFHPDFHSSLNMGIDYVAKEHGETALRAFLTRYTENVYGKTIAAVKERGLPALAAMIRDTYEKEKALDLMTTALTGDTLTVTVAECPGVKHLRKTGREVSAWYGCTTEMVMQTIADRCGLNFVMIRYDEETGAAQYRFEK
jgi:hypothetical protein